MKVSDFRKIVKEELQKIFDQFHVSPSGKKTNMSPNDDDYNINYRSDETREKIGKKVLGVSENIPPTKRGYNDLVKSYGQVSTKQDVGVNNYEKKVEPQLKRKIEGIKAILQYLKPGSESYRTVKNILDQATQEMRMPTDRQMDLISQLYMKSMKYEAAAGMSGMETTFATNKPQDFTYPAPNDEIKENNYRKASEELKKAWFEYKKNHPGTTLSLVDFAAGFNSATQNYEKNPVKEADNKFTGYANDFLRHAAELRKQKKSWSEIRAQLKNKFSLSDEQAANVAGIAQETEFAYDDSIKKSPVKETRQLSVPERHQLKIAYDTLKMPDAMVGVMGGPTKEEAKQIIKKLTGQSKVNESLAYNCTRCGQ